MAPFSTCSRCQVRTRKLVKDPQTLKLIYICPKCFKSKEYKDSLKKIKTPEQPKLEKEKVKPRMKITPPVMQTVVINGKKYIAISESADDD
ncbi:uncharacterized protein Dana_GF17147 [Drosophila ananassae]|uniref:Uncharacterized protein n=1 Tax=Drosophila ananassae TaxID=7217 RepID=A0A0P8ZY34_DROAN|nr:uncharacterized protein LOC6499935 [Drosophila ananassae]KPU79587.1 uncharacterized protein Dana_GF17147 [Drosophila ananassae]